MGTSNSERIGLHLADKFIAKLEKAGLTAGLAQKVNSSKDNDLARAMMATLLSKQEQQNLSKLFSSFEKVAEFKVQVNRIPLINDFRKEHGSEFEEFDLNLEDAEFRPSIKWQLGEEKTAVIYRTNRGMSINAIFKFIKHQGGQLPNAHGLIISYEQGKQYFPGGASVMGLDKPLNLKDMWEDKAGVPTIEHRLNDKWLFYLRFPFEAQMMRLGLSPLQFILFFI